MRRDPVSQRVAAVRHDRNLKLTRGIAAQVLVVDRARVEEAPGDRPIRLPAEIRRTSDAEPKGVARIGLLRQGLAVEQGIPRRPRRARRWLVRGPGGGGADGTW